MKQHSQKSSIVRLYMSLLFLGILASPFHPMAQSTLEACLSLLEYQKQENALSSSEIKQRINSLYACYTLLSKSDSTLLAQYHNSLAQYYIRLYEYKKAINESRKILYLTNAERGDSVQAYENLTSIYQRLGLQDKLLEAMYHLRQVSEEKPGSRDEIKGIEMSFAFASMGQYRAAVDALKEEMAGLPEGETTGEQRMQQYNHLGQYYLELGIIDSAELYLKQAISILDSTDYFPNDTIAQFNRALVYRNLGNLYVAKNDYENALQHIQFFIEQSEQSQSEKHEIDGKIRLLSIYKELGYEAELAKSIEELSGYGKARFTDSQKLELYKHLVNHYKKTGQQAKLQSLYSELIALQDSLIHSSNLRHFIRNQLVFQMEEQKRKLISTEAELAKKYDREWYAIIISCLLFTLLVFSLIFILLNRRKDKRLKTNYEKIESQYADLMQADQQNKFLLKELNHRVKNNLQMISGFLSIEESVNKSDDVKLLYRKLKNRVHSMAYLHDQLNEPEGQESFDMRRYLKDIAENVLNSFDKMDEISMEYAVDKIDLSFDKISPIGLIFNELITNSCKHAFDDYEDACIFMQCFHDGNDTHFVYRDNGVGMEEGTKDDSMGIMLVKGLSQQLGGEYEIKGETGFQFTLKLKGDEHKENNDR